MLRDVFYYGKKPNVHPRERYAENLEHARSMATTEHFWVINEFCDYNNFDWDFDFEFLPDEDVWAEAHNNVWPSQHQKDSGTWLCSSDNSDVIIYRNDVEPVHRKNEKHDAWVIADTIDESKFDFSWHPDPTDPPYIYRWGGKFFPVQLKHVLEYHVPNATDIKYMDAIVELIPEHDRWVEYQKIDKDKFDMSWRPDPMEPPFIYVWGNKFIDAKLQPTLEYHAPGATTKKYMPELLEVLPEWERWAEIQPVDKERAIKEGFDFSWRPDPREPAYVYTWGNKWIDAEFQPTLEYRCENATDRKYMPEKIAVLPEWDRWVEIQPVDKNRAVKEGFDFSWRPDPREPAYIYTWGNPWVEAEFEPTLEYHCEGATQRKYMDNTVHVLPQNNYWHIIHPIDKSTFDFSWRPDPREPNLIYVFGNKQHLGNIMPTVEYRMPGATERKYINDDKFRPALSPNPHLFEHLEDSFGIDYSWRPDPTSPPYIYVWGNQWNKAEDKISIQYVVEGATEYQYMEQRATRRPSFTHWQIPKDIDDRGFDYSWEPNPNDPPYIYEFATQWQKTGGPRYIISGATEVKYVDTQKVKKLPSMNNWIIPSNCDVTGFDFSWHPDSTSPPYIYHFATQWALTGGPIYHMDDATDIKYLEHPSAIALPDKTNWEVPEEIDSESFDFSWHPYVEDQPYIYQFGTQHQKTGGPRYVTPEATETSPIKYIDRRILKSKRKPSMKNWTVLSKLVVEDFDYSWHPDDTEEPYIYIFGNNLYSAEEMPTVQYRVKGARQIKYVDSIIAKLGKDLTNWVIPDNLDTSEFDFSWKPNPNEPPYIYEFGTQWQKTGGPCYVVPKATERKYVDGSKAKALPNEENWTVPSNIDISGFDFSWHPDNTSPAYIYVFATQWALGGGPVYTVPGATDVKYVEDQTATALPDKRFWEYDSELIDESSFDFSWHPYVEDQPYIYQFGTQHQKTGGPRYVTPEATETSPIKYIDPRILKAKRLPQKSSNWKILNEYDVLDFDYSWHPDETEEPYIYVFGNKYYSAEEMPTIEYRMPGAKHIKYVNKPVATLAPDNSNWEVPDNIDTTDFDFGWKPSPLEPPMIYQFGTQWAKTRGPKYIVPTALESKYVQTKYVDVTKAKALPSKKNWEIPNDLDIAGFDFSWHPDDTDPAYVYQFGTQWALTGGPRYVVPNATEVKYVEGIVAKAQPNLTNWEIPANIDVKSFDFSWHPYAEDDPFIYQFGTQHQKTGGPRYVVPNATKIKYVDTRILKAKRIQDRTHWYIPDNVDVTKFDFSWHPDDTADPAIYQFGSVVGKDDGPKYIVPENTGKVLFLENVYVEESTSKEIPKYFIETTLDDLISKHPNEVFWALNNDLDYSKFDFDWRPDVYQSNYIHAFGLRDNLDTQTYFVNAVIWEKGFRNINYVEDDKIQIKANLDMFYVDRGNPEAQIRFEALKKRFPKIQKTRYLNSWVDTVNRCTNRASTSLLWVLNSELDYTDFDFDYYPNAWQMKMVHVFGTQWSHWGTTFMVNRESFPTDTKYIKIIEHLNNLNFVKDNRAVATKCVYDIVLIDHGNKETNNVLEQLKIKAQDKTVITVKYEQSYLNTLRDVINKQHEKKEHYLWICSSVCDYKDFDFSYVCDPFARDQLHVFPSGKQKFGDTFFIDVNKTRELINDMNVLEDYEKVNYNATMRVPRLPEPVIVTSDDTLIDAAQSFNDWPYATIIADTDKNIEQIEIEPMNLWAPDTKTILVTSTGASRIIVPREVKDHVEKELYDYPYIKKSTKLAKSNPLDIVFLSNGETGADENYEHLLKVTKGLKNRVVRVDGVNGRAAAYHAAAEASNTPWMFTVFAKLKVSAKFDWNWQPDRMQVPKHYIFQAKNPVNGLVYGHQAMIAYNKKLTLSNEGKGLDFTLDDEHEVVELLSGTAMYNTDSFSTWRTAFREVLKLKSEDTDIARERLDAWLNKAEGDFAQYSIKGALDADEYYDEVDGDFEKLKLSYEWAWLRERFDQL
jgi:hypothetical protein